MSKAFTNVEICVLKSLYKNGMTTRNILRRRHGAFAIDQINSALNHLEKIGYVLSDTKIFGNSKKAATCYTLSDKAQKWVARFLNNRPASIIKS